MGRLAIACLLLVALLLPQVASAQSLDDAVRRVASQLQCPVCEGQTVADSTSGLAQDMRAVIRQRLQDGATDQEILDSFVASYGDSILTDPPKRGFTLGLWIGPYVMLALGLLVLAMIAVAWVRRGQVTAATAATAPVDEPVLDEFRRFKEELG